MISELETFFKDTPLGIKSVLQASVMLAEKVNSRMELSGKEKTDLVVKSLVEYLGEGKPELVALVEAVVPGMLEIVISTARGKYMLKQVTACLPPGLTACLPSVAAAPVAAAPVASAPVASAPVASAPVTQDPTNEASAQMASVWAWARSPFFRSTAPIPAGPVNQVGPVQNSPVTTIREPDSAL
jgi:hypothetical protein